MGLPGRLHRGFFVVARHGFPAIEAEYLRRYSLHTDIFRRPSCHQQQQKTAAAPRRRNRHYHGHHHDRLLPRQAAKGGDFLGSFARRRQLEAFWSHFAGPVPQPAYHGRQLCGAAGEVVVVVMMTMMMVVVVVMMMMVVVMVMRRDRCWLLLLLLSL
jgi:hypothetical protein